MLEDDYLARKRDLSNWLFISNDGVNVSARNNLINENFEGTLQDFYLMINSASDFVLDRDDKHTGSKVTIDIVHYKMHNGKYFSHKGKISGIVHDATYDHLLVNPGNNYPHFRDIELVALAAPIEYTIYENPTVTSNGTVVSSINLNRASTITSNLVIYHTPTVSAVGTEIMYKLVSGTSQTGGSESALFRELILKPNTNYLVRVKNISNQTTTIAFNSEWYE